MRAVVQKSIREVVVEPVEDARIEKPTDVLMRVTSSAICGTDLHLYDGRINAIGMVIGHEPLGIVEEVSSAVVSIEKGDRVVVPTHICCGFCANCVRGLSAACLITNPGSWGAAYGYPGMGGYKGAQAELVRIPFADANCVRLPGQPGDDWEHDFVLLADALPTGYHATELVKVSAGDTVAIFGAGAIGLLTALCSRLRGASEVYVVDAIDSRLRKAEELGAVPIDYRKGDPVEQIKEMLARNRRRFPSAWRGEGVMDGVTCGIDAVGFQAWDREHPGHEAPWTVVNDLARLINPAGRLGIIGVYIEKDPLAATEPAREGKLTAPWGTLFRKGISIGLGRDHDERYNLFLRDLIVSGRISPGRIVSHRLPLAEAPNAFSNFDERREGWIKIVLDVQK
ncbi:MAG: glutathione-independent formaldehyde dehydrogenase [Candidatus Binataceae bacterium]